MTDAFRIFLYGCQLYFSVGSLIAERYRGSFGTAVSCTFLRASAAGRCIPVSSRRLSAVLFRRVWDEADIGRPDAYDRQLYPLTWRSDEMDVVRCVSDSCQLYLSVGFSIKQMTLLSLLTAAIWTRAEGLAIMLMARGLLNTALMSFVEQRGKVFQDCRHGFQCLKDLTSSKNSFTASVSGSPSFLFPFIRNTSLRAAARIPVVGGRSAWNILSTAVKQARGDGACMRRTLSGEAITAESCTFSVVLVNSRTSSGFFLYGGNLYLFCRLFDPLDCVRIVQNCCKLCMFRQQVVFIWHGSFFLCYISDTMIGEYTAIVLRLIKIKKVHRVLRHTFHFYYFHSNYKRPILSLY